MNASIYSCFALHPFTGVIAILTTILKNLPAPAFLRSYNGSGFTAQSVQTWLEQNKQTSLIFLHLPGQLWNNGYIESFHEKFRDECLQRERFQSLLEAQVVIEA